MMTTSQPIRFEQSRAIDVEDQVRADFYALLANLFFRAPDERLLHAIMIAPEPTSEPALGDAMGKAWAALAAASAAVTADAVQAEFDKLFGGVGRAQLMPYGSYYLAGFLNEKPLAELRSDLARMGFSRDAVASETEDHLAALCDVMRAIILGAAIHIRIWPRLVTRSSPGQQGTTFGM